MTLEVTTPPEVFDPRRAISEIFSWEPWRVVLRHGPCAEDTGIPRNRIQGDRPHQEAAIKKFARGYGAKYPKAVASLRQDETEPLTFRMAQSLVGSRSPPLPPGVEDREGSCRFKRYRTSITRLYGLSASRYSV